MTTKLLQSQTPNDHVKILTRTENGSIKSTQKNLSKITKVIRATTHFFKHKSKTKVYGKGLDFWPLGWALKGA